MREIIGDHLFGQSSTQVTEGLGNSLVSALLWRSLFGYVMMCCCAPKGNAAIGSLVEAEAH
jgi:hypothetical protein